MGEQNVPKGIQKEIKGTQTVPKGQTEGTNVFIRKYQKGNHKVPKGVTRMYQRGQQKIPNGQSKDTKAAKK